MAIVPTVDGSLSRASSWMSYVAFVGIVALAYLPPRASLPPPAAVSPKAAAPVPTVSTPAAPASAKVTAPAVAPVGPAAVPAASAAATPSPPPADVWTPEQVNAGLRQCIQLLAPAAAEVELEEPMKKGQCGTTAPLALHSVGTTDKVDFTPAPTMNCRLAASLATWVEKVLQPAAQQVLGSRIKRIVGASSYSCRNIYNNPKLTLSEHATGNAIDIAGFITADGRAISVAKAWGPTTRDIAAAQKKAAAKLAKGSKDTDKPAASAKETAPPAAAAPSIADAGKKAEGKSKGKVEKANFKRDAETKQAALPPVVSPLAPSNTKEAGFLKRVHQGSCALFTTVLGPETNEAHRDHFHLDMKERKSHATVCH
ncbi:Extensin-like C-terminal domain-containing protein [Hyphomicrobium sp. 1Nfss2.1]|uniref:extensin-like domain-containing protein n=1 Tax=Hyphomicrobium sp. 1Nfss2.1 TaxID=3413936 RepID=UPI003C7C15EF